MSTPPTYGELMSLAYQHMRTAEQHIALARFPSPDAARAIASARHQLLLAAKEQGESLYGVLRLNAQQEARPERDRPNKGSAHVADPRAEAFIAWREAVPAVAPAEDVVSSESVSEPTVSLHRASQLVRAATDLLDTHRTTALDETNTLRDDGAVIEPLRIVQRLARTQHVYARSREAGLTAAEANALYPQRAWAALDNRTQELVLELPRQQTWLGRIPIAGTIRQDTPAHEWADRIERIPRRLSGLAARGPIGVDTMKAAAATGLVSHYLRSLNGTAPRQNPWFEVVEQMRSWESTIRPDARIAQDSIRLQQLAREARLNPEGATAAALAAEAELTHPAVDDLAAIANQAMPSVERWIRARPVPTHLRAPRAAPFVAHSPSDVPLAWPTPVPAAPSL